MYSNFITPPDYIETVLILNATEEQIKALGTQVQSLGTPYNVYFYNDAMNEPTWFHKISIKADVVLDAKINNPEEYFNK
jgi:ABC-type Fe3+-hydroxamate transport system substrate-binding protein